MLLIHENLTFSLPFNELPLYLSRLKNHIKTIQLISAFTLIQYHFKPASLDLGRTDYSTVRIAGKNSAEPNNLYKKKMA